MRWLRFALICVLFLVVGCSAGDDPDDRRNEDGAGVRDVGPDVREDVGDGEEADADIIDDIGNEEDVEDEGDVEDVDDVEDVEEVDDAEDMDDDEDLDDGEDGEGARFDYVVTTEANAGEGSLRGILEQAFDGARIGFSEKVKLIVVEEPLVVERGVKILGYGSDQLQISGAKFGRIFEVQSGVSARIEGLRLIDGRGGSGAAIYNSGVLELADCGLTGHEVRDDGGAIYNEGELFIEGCNIWENWSEGRGGALFNVGVMRVEGAYIAVNYAPEGGGIYNAGDLEIRQVWLTEGVSTVAGAGLYNIGEAEVWSSLFTYNTAANGRAPRFDRMDEMARGAAVYNAGELWMTNSTIFRNYGQFGGGLYNGGQVSIAQSTILGALGVHGGGLVHDEGAATRIRGILLDLTEADATGDRDIMVLGSGEGFESLGYNVVGVVDHNPGLFEGLGDVFGSRQRPLYSGVQRLGAYGGPLESVRLDPMGRAFAHVQGESCRDARGERLTSDIRGNVRPLVWSCDAGAYQSDFMQETFLDLPEMGDEPVEGKFLGRGYIGWSFDGVFTEPGRYETERSFVLADKGSRVYTESIPGGMDRFAIELRKSGPEGVSRQVEVRVNGEVVGTSKGFGEEFGIDEQSYGFLVEDLGIQGDVVIEIRNISGAPVVVENLRWAGE